MQNKCTKLSSSTEQLACLDPPKINYKSLGQICQLKNGKSHYDIDHDKFMKEYSQIFISRVTRPPTEERWRTLSANVDRTDLAQADSARHFHLRRATHSFRGNDESVLSTRLNSMITILQQHPPFRSHADIKKLASLLSHFPSLFTGHDSIHPLSVLEAIATRAVLERVREKNGLAFPREGVVYLILQGAVREVNKEPDRCKYTTKILGPGDIFGELKEPVYPPKHSYPVYQGYYKTMVMRITLTDFIRARQTVQEEQLQDNLKIISESVVLSRFPQNAQQKLAKLIKWKKLRPSEKLMQEGEFVKALTVVKKGHCKAFVRVPGCFGPSVCIGEIGESGCVGEFCFDDPKAISPYTVITTTDMIVGQIQSIDIDVDIRMARAPSHKQYSVKVPSKDELKFLYAERQAVKQWQSLKKTFVGGAYYHKR